MNETASTPNGLNQIKGPTLYKVGDTIKIINRGYNIDLFNENDDYLPKDSQIMEVEVKDVKTVKLIIE